MSKRHYVECDKRQRLGELTLKDDKDPHDFSLKIVLTKEDKNATLSSVTGVKDGATILGKRRLLESQGAYVTSGAISDVIHKPWWMSKKRKTPNDAN